MDRAFRRRATEFLFSRLLDGASHAARARSHEDEDCEEAKRIATVVVKRGHSDCFKSRESLGKRAMQSIERCRATGHIVSIIEGAGPFPRPDVEDFEKRLRLAGGVHTSLRGDFGCQDWTVRISFASGNVSDLVENTPFDGRLITGMRGEHQHEMEWGTEVAWDEEEAHLWSHGDGRKEWGRKAIVMSKCARLLLERAGSSEAHLATQRVEVEIYDQGLSEPPYLGCEHCLQFKVAAGDGAEEIPVEIYVLGVVRIVSDLDIIPTHLEEKDAKEDDLGEDYS